MQMARIRFAEKDKARGLVELARRVKVIALRGGEYLLAEPNLSLLEQPGLAYEVLGTEGFDRALRKIRNTAVKHPERRRYGRNQSSWPEGVVR